MKKLKKYIFISLLGAITLASCNKSKEEVYPILLELTNDHYETLENTSVVLDILSNDNIIGEDVQLELSNPQNGTLISNKENLTFTYTPNTSFIGKEILFYKVCIGNDCKDATVMINVKPDLSPTRICNYTVLVR